MHTHAGKTQENKSQSVAIKISQKQSGDLLTFHFVDNRPGAFAQGNLQEMANNSPQVRQLRPFKKGLLAIPQDNNSLLRKKQNDMDLPDNLKSKIENLSGYSMDNVRVQHYNSSKPAQLNALAYTKGSEIQIAPEQERHLPHEAWHVVQQKQGRVKPKFQLKGKKSTMKKGWRRKRL